MEKYLVLKFILFDNLTELRSSSNTVVCWYDNIYYLKNAFATYFKTNVTSKKQGFYIQKTGLFSNNYCSQFFFIDNLYSISHNQHGT